MSKAMQLSGVFRRVLCCIVIAATILVVASSRSLANAESNQRLTKLYTLRLDNGLSLVSPTDIQNPASEEKEYYIKFSWLSRDGTLLIIGGADNKVYYWDVVKREVTAILDTHSKLDHHWPNYRSPVSYDNRTLLTFDEGREAVVWDVETQKEILSIDTRTTVLNDFDFSPTTNLIALSIEGKATLWDIGARKEIFSFPQRDDYDRVYNLAFSPDGTRVALDNAAEIQIWDVVMFKQIATLERHKTGGADEKIVSGLFNMKFSHNGNMLFAVFLGPALYYTDGETRIPYGIRLWNIAQQTVIHARLNAFTEPIEFSPNDTRIIYGVNSVFFEVINVDTGRRDFALKPQNLNSSFWESLFINDDLLAMMVQQKIIYKDWSRDARYTLQLVDLSTAKIVDAVQVDFCGIDGMKVSPSGVIEIHDCYDLITIWKAS